MKTSPPNQLAVPKVTVRSTEVTLPVLNEYQTSLMSPGSQLGSAMASSVAPRVVPEIRALGPEHGKVTGTAFTQLSLAGAGCGGAGQTMLKVAVYAPVDSGSNKI